MAATEPPLDVYNAVREIGANEEDAQAAGQAISDARKAHRATKGDRGGLKIPMAKVKQDLSKRMLGITVAVASLQGALLMAVLRSLK